MLELVRNFGLPLVASVVSSLIVVFVSDHELLEAGCLVMALAPWIRLAARAERPAVQAVEDADPLEWSLDSETRPAPGSSSLKRQVPVIKSSLDRVRKLCSDGTRVLNESLVGRASSLSGGDGRSTGIQGYIRETGQLLSVLQGKLQQFQEQRRDRLEAINAIQEKTSGVLKSSSEIEKLGSKLKLLALNARIESAHAGEAGVGFDVVATEVGELGDQVVKLTQRISVESAETSRVLQAGRSVLLTQNEEEAEFSNETELRILSIAQDLGRMDSGGTNAIDLTALTEKASLSVGAAVRALQFEDMVNQLLADVVARLDGGDNTTFNAPDDRDATEVEGFSTVQQTSLEAGTVELF